MRQILDRVIPTFTELDLFAAGYAVALAMGAYSQYLLHIDDTVAGVFLSTPYTPTIFSGIAALFVLLTVHHVLSTREQGLLEKQFLLACMLCVLVLTIVALAITRAESNVSLILIAWNGLYVFWLLLWLGHLQEADEALLHHMVKDGGAVAHAKILTVAYTSALLFVVMVFLIGASGIVSFATLIVLAIPLASFVDHHAAVFQFKSNRSFSLPLVLVLLVAPVGLVSALGALFL